MTDSYSTPEKAGIRITEDFPVDAEMQRQVALKREQKEHEKSIDRQKAKLKKPKWRR